jgi:precorrin-2 dehydrogenase/sirohydrochlorin ferrochelatase
LRDALSRDAPAAGVVQFIDARGPADLLTLRAARVLASADVLICDEGAHADVLGLARRDAERLGPQAPERLQEVVAQGLRVARLITGTAWRQEQAELEAVGIETEVLPISG